MPNPTQRPLTCSDCGVLNCYRKQSKYPAFCLTEHLSPAEAQTTAGIYRTDPQVRRLAVAAAQIEGQFYGKLTRVEEIVAFAQRIGAKKIGIATCIGLIHETRTFTKILEVNGLQWFSALCKIGAIDKTQIGIPDHLKVQPQCHESMCNPVQQARILNAQKTDLNVIVGLCVGHDSVFIKFSDAPVTTLITKDRVLGHNPAAALYTSSFYYKRLLTAQDFSPPKPCKSPTSRQRPRKTRTPGKHP